MKRLMPEDLSELLSGDDIEPMVRPSLPKEDLAVFGQQRTVVKAPHLPHLSNRWETDAILFVHDWEQRRHCPW